jgi:hypothetical protein
MRSKGFPGGIPALAMIGFGALVGAFVPGSVSAVPAAHTYYVSPSGDDTANGWTKKTAWRTLSWVAQQRFVAGDRLLLEGGVVHPGSIALDPSNSAGDFEIGSYGGGRAIIDAGNHSGIVIKNLNDIKISALVIRGNGGTTANEDLLARKNGILITSQVDASPQRPFATPTSVSTGLRCTTSRGTAWRFIPSRGQPCARLACRMSWSTTTPGRVSALAQTIFGAGRTRTSTLATR